MSWDVSKQPAKVRLWEGLVFALLPTLIGLVALGQILGAPRMLAGFFFLMIPLDAIACVVAFDEVRRRNGFWC
jgi:hypothetical protein